MKKLVLLIFVVMGAASACTNDTGTDCGDGTIGSESHWANCGANVSTNNGSYNDAGGESDSGNVGNNGNTNNTSGNNTSGNNATTGNNSTSGPDAGGPDAGGDAGMPEPEVCYAHRWDDTTRRFDSASCLEQDNGTWECDCFDSGRTQSIAVQCTEALSECGASPDEISSCAMTAEAGCTETADGWECTCQGIDGVFTSTESRCDSAYYESCYMDQFCEAELGPGLQGRCIPTLDENYAATGFVCGCYQNGFETIEPFAINREVCLDAASVACGE